MLKFKQTNNSRAYDQNVKGWEYVFLRSNGKVFPEFVYENPTASLGGWHTTEELKGLLLLWVRLLNPGDELIVESHKDRGSGKPKNPLEGADVHWVYEIIDE